MSILGCPYESCVTILWEEEEKRTTDNGLKFDLITKDSVLMSHEELVVQGSVW